MLKLALVAAAVAGLFLIVTRPAFAKEPLPMDKAVYKDAGAKELPYRLLRPANAQAGTRYPLVVFLHGAGERGTDNEKQLVHGVAQFVARREQYPCFLIAPQCPGPQKWVEVDWAGDSHTLPKDPGDAGRMVLELIEKSLTDLPIDPKRVYLTGLSMGGYGTWDLAARKPEWFAAIAPVCGGADELTAPTIKHLPIWAFHGAKDTAVKPQRSRNMIAALKASGGSPKYTEYPTVGHNSWDNAYADPAFYEWLFAQTK